MTTVRVRTLGRGSERKLGALVIAAVAALMALLAASKIGIAGLAVPLAAALLVAVFRRPKLAVGTTVGLTILCEGPSFGIPAISELYRNLYSGLEPLDLLVLLAFFSVGFDLLRRRRQPRLSATPALALVLVTLAMLSGIAVGNGAGVPLKEAALSLHVVPFLIMMPLAVFNLDLDRDELIRAVRWLVVLAEVKALAGLFAVLTGLSTDVVSGARITYYEPTANWVVMVAMLGLLGAGLSGALRPPSRGLLAWRPFPRLRRADIARPVYAQAAAPPPGRRVLGARSPLRSFPGRVNGRLVLLGLPLLIACLVLSYRRSFWVAAVLGVLLVVALASTAGKRLTIAVSVVLIAGGVWAVGAVPSQAQSPIVQRVQSLSPNRLTTNAEDRYRLDERANVIAEIKQNPIGGLGADVPWVAIARPLGLEHVGGRFYVHFAVLWWWLKLGVLGAAAYLALLLSMALLAFRTWRRNSIPELRYFGLASLCAAAGLAGIETTATFTGVDPRFSAIFGAQLGFLALMARRVPEPDRPRRAQPASSSADPPPVPAGFSPFADRTMG